MNSYARLDRSEAFKLASLTVSVIEVERRALDKKRADAAIGRREKLRRYFRWLKPMTAEQARIAVLLAGKTSCTMYWSAYTRAQAILQLVKAAGSDPFIYITADDYSYIQFGTDHVRLSTN